MKRQTISTWNSWIYSNERTTRRDEKAEDIGLKDTRFSKLRLSDTQIETLTSLLRKRLDDNTVTLPDPNSKIDFTNTYFDEDVCFSGFEFKEDVDFSGSHFSKKALFRSARFWGDSHFISAKFGGLVDFRNAIFFYSANFREASFSDVAIFEKSIFGANSCFSSATFNSGVSFEAVTFKGEADFEWYEYNGIGYEKAPYPVRFFGKADFNYTKFEAATNYTDAQFSMHVPEFHGAELFEKTLFPTNANDDGNWPPRDEDKNKSEGQMPVGEQAFAYNRLQQFMNKTMRIDEEQFFHRMEMRCKGKVDGGAYGVMHAVFDAVSEYGNSVWKPLQWLFGLWFVGWVVYLHRSPIIFGEAPMGKATAWSFANLFPLFGFQKRFFGDEDLHTAILVTGGVQTVAGFILLFFLGLGLRNRFRLR